MRLDALDLRPGLDCTTEFGSKDECACWDTDGVQAPCDDYTECSGGDGCGPASWDESDNDRFTVKIWLQDKYDYLGTEKIRRDTNCNWTVDFDVKKSSGNKNRQVNQTVSTSIDNCGVNSGALGGEIRHIEVLDSNGDIVAVTTH